jgi:hypothetical protein
MRTPVTIAEAAGTHSSSTPLVGVDVRTNGRRHGSGDALGIKCGPRRSEARCRCDRALWGSSRPADLQHRRHTERKRLTAYRQCWLRASAPCVRGEKAGRRGAGNFPLMRCLRWHGGQQHGSTRECRCVQRVVAARSRQTHCGRHGGPGLSSRLVRTRQGWRTIRMPRSPFCRYRGARA